jgi:hypothetical protein
MMAVAALLAACADEAEEEVVDLGGDVDPTDETPLIAGGAAVGDVEGLTYDGTNLTVTVALDADTETATYATAGTVGTYNRFTQQDEPTDRAFTAFAKTSDDGSITAVAVSDGGQFNRFFGGARVVQNSYTAPTTGLVSYGGDYVGLLNFGPPAAGAPAIPGVQPIQSSEVTGTVFLNADFNSAGKVNGSIYNRENITASAALPDIILTAADINADGTFTNSVELNDADLTNVGSYAGVFGGTNGSAIGGVIDLNAGFLGVDVGTGFENEYGIFVLNQCPGGGMPAECFNSEGIDE